MIKTYNKINRVLFPMANSLGYTPVKFKNEILDLVLKLIKDIDNGIWVVESGKLHDDVVTDTKKKIENQLLILLKKK